MSERPYTAEELRNAPVTGVNALRTVSAMITEDTLPAHACGLYLSHNTHKDSYMPVVDYVYGESEPNQWRDAEAMKRAVETNEVWELQWYPRTPIGFIRVYAPTLPELLVFAKEVEQKDIASEGH